MGGWWVWSGVVRGAVVRKYAAWKYSVMRVGGVPGMP
jgi:hypothetical protein